TATYSLETAVAGIRAYEEQMGTGKIVLQFDSLGILCAKGCHHGCDLHRWPTNHYCDYGFDHRCNTWKTVRSASIEAGVWGVLANAIGQYAFLLVCWSSTHQTGLAFCFLGHSRLRRQDCCWWLRGFCHL
ncbi:MAG: hypothetical protein RLY87_629, partial [Chloroflexota bacterium]